jgi:ankyrin repeat protein
VGNIEAVKQHLDAGADVNAKTRTGRTPLHNGDTKRIVELLIAKGANVNALILSGSHQGKTPLDTADNKEIANLLRKHGGKTGAELK